MISNIDHIIEENDNLDIHKENHVLHDNQVEYENLDIHKKNMIVLMSM